jgi:hypothetical protein
MAQKTYDEALVALGAAVLSISRHLESVIDTEGYQLFGENDRRVLLEPLVGAGLLKFEWEMDNGRRIYTPITEK